MNTKLCLCMLCVSYISGRKESMPLACLVYNLVEDLKSHLGTGTIATFGATMDHFLSRLSQNDKKKAIK